MEIFPLEKNSCWHLAFGKKFLLKLFLWKKTPVLYMYWNKLQL